MHRSVLAIAILLAAHLAVAAMAETNPFLEAGIPAPSRATRMAGPKEMNEGVTTVFVSTEGMLAEENGFAAEDLSRLLDAMASTLLHLKKGIPSDVRIELRKKLEADKARFKKEEDARRLDQIIAELGGA